MIKRNAEQNDNDVIIYGVKLAPNRMGMRDYRVTI